MSTQGSHEETERVLAAWAPAAADAAPAAPAGVGPVEPRAEIVAAQKARAWDSPRDVSRNLEENPDLSTWSEDQLGTLNALAGTSAGWEQRVDQGVARYAGGVGSVDEIPSRPAMQQLLHERLLDGVDARCEVPTPQMSRARAHLDTLVDAKVTAGLDGRLAGAEGDDDLKSALDEWATGVRSTQLAQPALASRLARAAQEKAAAYGGSGRFEDVRRADDSFLEQAGHTFSDATESVGASFESVAEGVYGLGEGLPGPMRYTVGTGQAAGFIHAAGQTVASLGQSGTYQGLAKMASVGNDLNPMSGGPTNLLMKAAASGQSPIDVVQQDAAYGKTVAEGFVSGYGDTRDKYGVEGVLGHLSFDVLTAVGTDGAGAAAKTAVVGKLAEAGDALKATSLVERMTARVRGAGGALEGGGLGCIASGGVRQGRAVYAEVQAARAALPPQYESIVKTAAQRAEAEEQEQRARE